MSDAIDGAQQQVGEALAKARAGDDRELAAKVRELGEQFVRMFTGAMRMTRFHHTTNKAFEPIMKDLARAHEALLDLLGMVQVIMVEDQVYVNDQRLRMDDRIDAEDGFGPLWLRHGVGGMNFHGPLPEEQWRRLSLLGMGPVSAESPRAAMLAAIEAEGIQSVELLAVFRFQMKDEFRRSDKDLNAVMARASGVVDGLWGALASGRAANPLPVRKAVNELVDLDMDSEEESLARGRRDQRSHALSRHSRQVAALSMLLGRALGLPETALADLGVTACFHDVGYAMEEDGYAPPFSRHGTAGVRSLLSQRGFHEARIYRMLACLEHHRSYDEGNATLFARILHICDDFETLTRLRPGGALMSPPTAIARMRAASGQEYDPDLLQLFINRVGAYPPGSVLELDDGRWVLVISGVRSPETFDLPLTEVVREADGSDPIFAERIDLAEGARVRRVVE